MKIIRRFEEADGLVVASPVYYPTIECSDGAYIHKDVKDIYLNHSNGNTNSSVKMEKCNMMTFYYVVHSLDGDYAKLKRTDTNDDELKLVARALLPDGIREGSFLKYENMEYFILKL